MQYFLRSIGLKSPHEAQDFTAVNSYLGTLTFRTLPENFLSLYALLCPLILSAFCSTVKAETRILVLLETEAEHEWEQNFFLPRVTSNSLEQLAHIASVGVLVDR